MLQAAGDKDGHRFSFTPDPFGSKQEAELHAHDRTRYFLQRKLGVINVDVLGRKPTFMEELGSYLTPKRGSLAFPWFDI
jgi:hypothetical protein